MKGCKADDTHQSYLLPPSPQEWLLDIHLARVTRGSSLAIAYPPTVPGSEIHTGS